MTALTRKPDWESRFYPALDNMRHLPFVWGKHDCVLMAADLIEVITGTDLVAEYRGKYGSYNEALKLLKTLGKGDLISTVTEQLGEPIHIYKACRGDVVLIQYNDREILGIVTGTVAVAPGKDGTITAPMRLWTKAWKV